MDDLVSPVNDSDWPWGVAFPGLTASGAEAVVEALARDHPEIHAVPIDPGDFMLLHIDRDTAQDLLEALGDEQSSAGARGIVESLAEWLGQPKE